MLFQFYAVTESRSIYLVSEKQTKEGFPTIKKIFLQKESKSLIKIGEYLKGGSLIGITTQGILLYTPDYHQNPPDLVKISYWGAKTSAVVALFVRRDEALECINNDHLEILDCRWKKKTEEVIKSIGKEHLVFKLGSELLKLL